MGTQEKGLCPTRNEEAIIYIKWIKEQFVGNLNTYYVPDVFYCEYSNQGNCTNHYECPIYQHAIDNPPRG